MKKFKFYDPMYFANVEIHLGVPLDEHRNGGLTVFDKVEKKGTFRYYLINLENKKDFYSLMHECIHLVKAVFTDRGIPFTSENDESIAYYHSYWFKRIWRKINK